jgi:hypothetical protein
MILVSSILSITGTPSNGSLPIGNGQGFTVNTLTAGTNVTITNGPGTITIAATSSGGTPAGASNEIQYNNSGAFGANSNLAWDIANNRAIIGTEVVASPNSRCVIIGKGGGTNQTFAVHNNTGTNNSFVVRDDGRVGIGTSTLNGSGIGLNLFGGATGTSVKLQNTITGQGSGDGFEISMAAGVSTVGIYQLENDSIDIYTNSILRSQFLANGNTVFFNSVGIGTNSPVGTLEVRKAGANAQFYNTTNGGDTDFYLTGNNAGGSPRYGLFRFIANNFTNGGLYYLPNTTTTSSASVVFTATSNVLIGTTSEGASATKTLVINNGTAPSGNVTDSFQQYSADIVAGNAAPHFRTENGNVVKIYQETTSVPSATFVQNSGTRVDEVSTFDGYTIAQVVRALRNQGLLA